MNIRTIWRGITATRYTRALEMEVARLRAENRALLNSILGIAGVPPITVSLPTDAANVAQVFRPEDVRGDQRESSSRQAGMSYINPTYREADASHMDVPPESSVRGPKRVRSKVSGDTVTPMRRRSWHQIYRMLEIDSARKKPQETVDIPPATTRS
jgi:hypothetical protein